MVREFLSYAYPRDVGTRYAAEMISLIKARMIVEQFVGWNASDRFKR